ncbi:MAG: hypothetical protein ACRDRL_04655 [Sciscionella sp.]
MWWGLGGALVAACCYGLASVLQALAVARADTTSTGMLALFRLVFRPWFLVGTLLDMVGFAGHLIALQTLPLVVAQAAMAGSLAVTAVVARWVLRLVLRSREWIGVLLVCVGLGLLASSTGQAGTSHAGDAMHAALLAAVPVLALAGGLAIRLPYRLRTAVLGLISGLGFADVAIAGRVLNGLVPSDLATDPACYALVLCGVVSFLIYAVALRDGGVTVATAMMLVGDTVVPTLVGVAILGDQTLAGFTALAVIGFAAAIVGTLALARFGDLRQGAAAVVEAR